MIREMAEISCLACGRHLGTVERVAEGLRLLAAPESPTAAQVQRRPGSGLVCSRCGGRALVGPMEKIVTYAA